MNKYRLGLIDFSSAMGMEEGIYILQSKKEPTEEECLNALYEYNSTGAIYFEGIKEIKEKDFRYSTKEKTIMNMENRK